MRNETGLGPHEPTNLVACPNCDLLFQENLAGNDVAYDCPRCRTLLYRGRRGSLETMLALACAALVALALANSFPVLGLEINGQRTETTMLGAVAALWRENMQPVAALTLLTAIVAPLLELAAIVWLVLPLWLGRRPPAFAEVFRTLRLVHPWAMPEVLILGMLVSMVKLAHFADLLPGVGIWAFGGLMLLLTALSAITEPRELWRDWEAARE
jgi:paraquat-inducible protein A